MILYYVIIVLKEVSQTILFINSFKILMNKTHYSILAIVMVMTLGIALAAPSAFALSQSANQGIAQSTGQTQLSGLNLFSPQTSAQANGQSINQNACVFVSIVCG